jgi:hypothetical protein
MSLTLRTAAATSSCSKSNLPYVDRVHSDHQRLDPKSMEMHCLLAKELPAGPALIAEARKALARWKAQAAEPVPSYF